MNTLRSVKVSTLTSLKVSTLRSFKVFTLRSPKVNTLRDFAQHLRMIQIFKQNVLILFYLGNSCFAEDYKLNTDLRSNEVYLIRDKVTITQT